MSEQGSLQSARARRWLALILAAGAFVAVFLAQRDQGIVRDETVYMSHGDKYFDWWSQFSRLEDGAVSEPVITKHFGGAQPTANNREHPPLMKTLFGLSHWLFHGKLGWTDEVSAYRMPSAAMNALLIALIFLWVASVWGTGVGLLAALCTLFLPRAFFHAGLACFDASVVTMWMATLWAYHRALHSFRWCIWLGLIFGLALATKHNALMLPVVMALHYLFLALRSQKRTWLEGRGVWVRVVALWHGFLAVQPFMVVSLAVIGPLVLLAVWPWLWFDTIDHVTAWVRFHLDHVHYNFEYLGDNWNAAPYPWHVPLITTLFTVPVATLLAAVAGAGAHVRALLDQGEAPGSDRALMLLLVLSAGVAMGPFLLGRVPIFGAEKHWAPAIPTLCILAAIGVKAAAELCAERLCRAQFLRPTSVPRASRRLALVLGALVVGAGASETVAAHPYALSHYNALAGGAPGGADLGMNRQFWGYAARGVLDQLERRSPVAGARDSRVYSHDASMSWGWYIRAGLLDRSLRDAGRERSGVSRSSLALVVHELHFNRHDYMIWDVYGTVQPVYVLTFQGVPIVSVYQRPPRSPPGGARRR